MKLTLEEGLKIIRQEMFEQAKKHRDSALKKLAAYKVNKNLNSLVDVVRLDVTAESLDGVGKAMTIEKVKKWRDDSGGQDG